MKYLVLLCFVILLPEMGKAQGDCSCSSEDDNQKMLRNGLIGIEYSNPVLGYEGDQFLRDWAYGEIRLNNGVIITDIVIRYDRYMDEVLWLRSKDYRKGILNKSEIAEFRIYQDGPNPEELFVKKKIRLPFLDTNEVFVHEMVQGKIELFAYRNVKKEPVENKLHDATKHVNSTKDHDYLIRLRRKNLLELQFINKEQMKKVLRRNHIAVRNNESGLARAIRLYNQL
jgi:hypothetical protein